MSTKVVATMALAAVTAAVAGGAARGTGNAGMVVKLRATPGFAVAGTATLTPVGQRVRVVVRLTKQPKGSLPMHLHIGPCRIQPNFNVWESLANAVRGRSTTLLEYTSWAKLKQRRYSIHVHRLPDYTLVACGDVAR
jgi:hypothetical protein